MEGAELWKAALRIARLPTALGKRLRRFPHLPQPLLPEKKSLVRI